MPDPTSFNPRPHAGGDINETARKLRPWLVSIHAPTRGATPTSQAAPPAPRCFNPRPHAGGDGPSSKRWCITSGFNPRPHAGGDYSDAGTNVQFTPVSIHAPTRGATLRIAPALRWAPVSIHAPTRGATRPIDRVEPEAFGFQSTPPRGGRRAGEFCCHCTCCSRFNPRPHAGGDHGVGRSRSIRVFQSTPPRGGRRRHPLGIDPSLRFQSTPPRGGRRASDDPPDHSGRVSIHAPTRGATSSRSAYPVA